MRWINKWMTPVMHDELYHRAKFGEDRAMRAGCRCENVVFVFFVCFCLAAGCHGNLTVLNLLSARQ